MGWSEGKMKPHWMILVSLQVGGRSGPVISEAGHFAVNRVSAELQQLDARIRTAQNTNTAIYHTAARRWQFPRLGQLQIHITSTLHGVAGSAQCWNFLIRVARLLLRGRPNLAYPICWRSPLTQCFPTSPSPPIQLRRDSLACTSTVRQTPSR